jgi:S1-C subfamily serine protease
MAGVPVDALTDKYAVSYVPSGTFLARLKKKPVLGDGPLLALGDPVFGNTAPPAVPSLPPGGILIKQVLAGGNGARAALQVGDVLLTYAGVTLTSYQQYLGLVQEHGGDKSIAIRFWREGKTADVEVPPGKLGVTLDLEPAPQAIAAKREAD